jgi:hypothetical protein
MFVYTQQTVDLLFIKSHYGSILDQRDRDTLLTGSPYHIPGCPLIFANIYLFKPDIMFL